MKIGLDTNVLAYFAGVDHGPDDDAKVARSRHVVRLLRDRVVLILPTQVLGELYVVMVRNGRSRSIARDIVATFAAQFETVAAPLETFTTAFDLATDHKLQLWDSLIISTAANADCALLLSEDMQDGFTVRGMTIANPFLETVQPALGRLLNG